MTFFCLFSFCLEIRSFFSLVSMLGSSEIRQLCPSVSFLFARLGASLGSFHTYCPPIEGLIFGGNSLGLVLTDLYPLLR